MAVITDANILADGAALSGQAAARGGLESIFEFDGTTGINDRSRTQDRIVVEATTGFIGDVQYREQRQTAPNEHGDIPGKSLIDGRTMTIRGYIETSRGMARMRELHEAFMSIFNSPHKGERKLAVRSNFGIDIFCYAKANAVTSDEQQTDLRYKRDFLITLRAGNPRFLSDEALHTVTILPGIFPNSDVTNGLTNWGHTDAGTVLALALTSDPNSTADAVGQAISVSINNNSAGGKSPFVFNTNQRTVGSGEQYYLTALVSGIATGAYTANLGYVNQTGNFQQIGLVGTGGGLVKNAAGQTLLEGILTVPAGVTGFAPAIQFVTAGNTVYTYSIDSMDAYKSNTAKPSLNRGSIDNVGNFEAQPIIAITGPFDAGLKLINLNTGDTLRLKDAIPAGATWTMTYDGVNRSLLDQNLISRFGSFDPAVSTQYFNLAKRVTNRIVIADKSGTNNNSKVVVSARDTWL